MPAERFRLAPHKLVHWWKRCLTPVAFRAPYSRIRILIGGIAQLVERQLCKLDVRGSNPLASKGISVRQKKTRTARLRTLTKCPADDGVEKAA